MAFLVNLTKDQKLLDNVVSATSLKDRTRGLIGKESLDSGEGLWIHRCNWIHTFFMSMPIDVIYVGRDMKVKRVQKNIKPWRLPAPVFAASSVIEVAAGATDDMTIEPGDTLHVGD